MELLSEATKRLASASRHVVVHIGAGTGEWTRSLHGAKGYEVILVEPHPMRANRLQAAVAQSENVNVIGLAVAADAGKAVLNEFNVSDFSSLRKPDGLRQLFPGLRLQAEIEVSTLTFGDLLARLPACDVEGADLLFIDAPGEELEIVRALVAHPDRLRFGAVLIRVSDRPLFADGESGESVLRIVEDAGYAQLRSDLSDSDVPVVLFASRPDRGAIEKLKQSLSEAESRLKEASAVLAERDGTIEDLKALVVSRNRDLSERTDQVAQRDKLIDQKNIALAEKTRELGERAGVLSALEKARADRDDELVAVNAALEQARADLMEARAFSEDADTKLVELNKAHMHQLEVNSALLLELNNAQQEAKSTGDVAAAAAKEFEVQLERAAVRTGELESRVENIAAEKSALFERATLAETALNTARETATAAASRLEAEAARIEQLDRRVGQIGAENAALVERSVLAETELETTRQAALETASRLEMAEGRLRALAHERAELDGQAAERTHRLERQIDEIAEQLGAAGREIEAAHESRKSDLARMQQLEGELETARSAADSEIATLIETVGVREGETEKIRKSLSDLEAELVQATNTAAGLSSEVRAASDERDKVSAKLAESTKAKDALWVERDEARKERDNLKLLLAQSEQRQADLKKKIEESNAAHTALKKEAAALQERLQEIDLKRTVSREELHRSEGQLQLLKEILLHDDRSI